MLTVSPVSQPFGDPVPAGRAAEIVRGAQRMLADMGLASLTEVTLANGRRVRAWLYRYRGPRERSTPIHDGDYRRARPPAARPATSSIPGRTRWR
jgi:hypothetical protein